MTPFPDLVIAATSIAALIIAVLTFAIQNKRARMTTGIEMLMRLDKRYNGAAMTAARRRAAAACLRGENDFDDILSFFELAGLMVASGVVDPEFAWCNFFYEINCYCTLAADQVIEDRQGDRTIWENAVQLHWTVRDIERRKRKCDIESLTPGNDELREFLQGESQL